MQYNYLGHPKSMVNRNRSAAEETSAKYTFLNQLYRILTLHAET